MDKIHQNPQFFYGEIPIFRWPGPQVYVGGLDLAVRDVDLLRAFERYSSVSSAKAGPALVPHSILDNIITIINHY